MINLTLPRTGTTAIDRVLELVERGFRAVDAFVFSPAVLVGPVSILTTDTRVHHGLGGRPKGYVLVKAPADVRIFDGATPETTDPANYISLRASSAQTVTLVVF